MSILAEGKTPEEWAAVLAERSIPVSVRTLREAANRIGACHKLGRAMIITPDQMDMILQEGQQCRSNRISAGPSSGFGSGFVHRRYSRTLKISAKRRNQMEIRNQSASLLRGRLQVQVLPGSPVTHGNICEKSSAARPRAGSMRNFTRTEPADSRGARTNPVHPTASLVQP